MTEASRVQMSGSITNEVRSLVEGTREMRTPGIRKISGEFFRQTRGIPKEGIFELCGKLLDMGEINPKKGLIYRTLAFDWAFKIRKEYTRSDFELFQSWLNLYVRSWGACDDFCTHALGHLFFLFPELVRETKRWARSSDRWHRRASAVSTIYSLRRRKLLDEAFQIADILLTDTDDMVQKGYGWMLKEASKKFPADVFNYVMIHKPEMPRTALRYAIEKLNPVERAEAMKRDKKS